LFLQKLFEVLTVIEKTFPTMSENYFALEASLSFSWIHV